MYSLTIPAIANLSQPWTKDTGPEDYAGPRLSTEVRNWTAFDNENWTPSLGFAARTVELSPNLGDGLRDQAAAVWDCEDAGLAATSIPSMNLTP